MKKLLRVIAIAVLGVSMSAGVAAAQTNIDNGNGTNSDNTVRMANDLTVRVNNTNDVGLGVTNGQHANSGDAEANRNTTVSDVGTGEATNTADVRANLDITNDNSTCSCLLSTVGNTGGGVDASIHNGNGTNSDNRIVSNNDTNVTVNNTNHVNVGVTNTQTANSGDSEANANITVGNVTTGGASNSFSSDTSIHISN